MKFLRTYSSRSSFGFSFQFSNKWNEIATFILSDSSSLMSCSRFRISLDSSTLLDWKLPFWPLLQIITYDPTRGGVSVVTEKGDITRSFLLVQEAKPSDSGRYTCNPSNAQSKSITVHVLNGEWFRLNWKPPFCPTRYQIWMTILVVDEQFFVIGSLASIGSLKRTQINKRRRVSAKTRNFFCRTN